MLEKSLENRLRLQVDREGYTLRKNPERVAYQMGNYTVADSSTGFAVSGGFYDLEEVEEWLAELVA